ncbi:fatty acid desaturase [Undibacterium sp.]|uniref:DesA family fatty acid desaturase n=1 Tax=Undibacterium sp. TaxID=1914977 RepID=UPI00374DF7DF
MEAFLFSGLFDLPWWGLVIVALGLTHITIASVTIFLHRHQAHRSLDLHPVASHFFRLWLWLTTGMVTKEWTAIHRKHHAKCDTVDDPHSPQIHGINRVLWGGVVLYVKESSNGDTMQRYGAGTPDDWLERNVYSRYVILGLTLMGLTNVALFGLVPGVLILITQIAWIPFWAAGVINGVGHFWGYRHWSTEDSSTNISPWGILIGGEELHNNHHAYPTSAKLSSKWYEFDIGWMYIRILETLGLARVKHVAPTPQFASAKPVLDPEVLQAVIRHRYDVLAKYAKSLKRTYAEELGKLRRQSPQQAQALQTVKPLLSQDHESLPDADRVKLADALSRSHALQTMYAMRHELAAIWGRSTATSEQLVKQLQDWCHKAEASGITPLVEFSQRLRCYV